MKQGIQLRRSLLLNRGILIRSLSTAPPKADASTGSIIGDDVKAGKHLKITAAKPRMQVITEAVVTDVRQESPTVRGVTLRVDNPHFNFKAGQWIDMFIPGMETVGGFSIYSCPNQLIEKGTLELGIKIAQWPPAFWIHTQCKVGSTVEIRGGGDFFYAPEIGDPSHDILLVAGGVGLNPLASIYFHAAFLHRQHQKHKKEYCPGKILLMYSAKSHEELLYKNLLDRLADSIPDMNVKYFTTRIPPPSSPDITHGHITKDNLKAAVESLDITSLKAFICGPPPMIEKMNSNLLKIGLHENQIYYEKWW